jgi:hypothetical protein
LRKGASGLAALLRTLLNIEESLYRF